MSDGDVWLEIQSGRARWRVRSTDGDTAPRVVPGGAPLTLMAGGFSPDAEVAVSVGAVEVRVAADSEGRVRWSEPRALRATAGRVEVAVELPGSGRRQSMTLVVEPTRFAQEALERLLADLSEVAAGLAADLGGVGELASRGGTPEDLLRGLESIVGQLTEAAPWIRSRPIGRARREVLAVRSLAPRHGARDLRWLATHPVHRSRAPRGQVGVVQRHTLDLDVPENRGAVWVFGQVEARLRLVDERLRAETTRLEATREAREAFLTEQGNLFDLEDRPRLRAVARRARRAGKALRDLEIARARTGLPARLRPEALRRTAQLEAHPGYWRLSWALRRLDALGQPLTAPSFFPAANLDRLYERWVLLRLASLLARLAGRSLGSLLELERDGWFARLPRGACLRFALGAREIVLHYEPRYHYGGGADGPLAKLHRGRAWCPDAVIEVRAAGQPVELHVFDAKHQVAHGGGPPWEALQDIWFKYVESIGFAETGLPAVASAWIVYPGAGGRARLLGPQMLSEAWPPERARGGAIALRPGESESGLESVLSTVLGVPARRGALRG